MARRGGFTLVELVVVIMILGILAAVAVPKMVTTTGNATDNGLRQTLSVVRDAIEMYSSENYGKLPGATAGTEAAFKADIKKYLRGNFPKAPVGALNDTVKITTAAGTMTGAASPAEGWQYNTKDGGFICNYSKASNDAAGTTYDQF